MGIDVDIRHIDSDLTGYDVIVAPAIQIMDRARADRITTAARHSRLVVGPRTAFRLPTGQVHPMVSPGRCAICSAARCQFRRAANRNDCLVDGEEVLLWAESYQTAAQRSCFGTTMARSRVRPRWCARAGQPPSGRSARS